MTFMFIQVTHPQQWRVQLHIAIKQEKGIKERLQEQFMNDSCSKSPPMLLWISPYVSLCLLISKNVNQDLALFVPKREFVQSRNSHSNVWLPGFYIPTAFCFFRVKQTQMGQKPISFYQFRDHVLHVFAFFSFFSLVPLTYIYNKLLIL